MISKVRSLLSRLPRKHSLPLEFIEGLRESQALAYQCARDISRELKEGWTEIQTAHLMDVYLRDCGVKAHFHKSFAWFGDRTRFEGLKSWLDFLPTDRPVRHGDCVILDTGPIYRGTPADIGYSFSLGENAEFQRGRDFLIGLRADIPKLFSADASRPGLTGGEICRRVVAQIRQAGYDAVHHRYPGAVLGHRLHPMAEGWRPPTFIPFSWQVLTRLLHEGIYPDLLNEEHRGQLRGAWAVEPHFGGKGFGGKFEEVLIVDEQGARWLSPEIPW